MSQYWPNITILTKFHNFSQISQFQPYSTIWDKYHNFDQISQYKPNFRISAKFYNIIHISQYQPNMTIISKFIYICYICYLKSSLQTLTGDHQLSFENMQLLTNLFFLVQQLRTTSGLRVIDNGLGPLVFGAEENIVDFALLAADRKATLPSQVQAFCFQYLEMLNIWATPLSSPSAPLCPRRPS